MRLRISKEPKIRAEHNKESWEKIRVFLGNGVKHIDDIIACCDGHQFEGGAVRFVKYCVERGWLSEFSSTELKKPAPPTDTGIRRRKEKLALKESKSLGHDSGLYLVTLTNTTPISVNATDKRMAHIAIKVTKRNCKLGKAENFVSRRKYYERIFGEYLNFAPLVLVPVSDLSSVEKSVSICFDDVRIRGRASRKTEWMENIEPSLVIKRVRDMISEVYPNGKWLYDE